MTVDKCKNQEYYQSEKSLPCECSGCQNFICQIKGLYPKLAEYFESLGIDILRPYELHYIDIDDNTIQYLLCQYLVFGTCEDKFSKSIDGITLEKSNGCYPPVKTDGEHFVIEFKNIRLSSKNIKAL